MRYEDKEKTEGWKRRWKRMKEDEERMEAREGKARKEDET